MNEPVFERIAAAALQEGVVDAAFGYADTSLGRLLVVETPRGVCRVAFPEEPEDRVLAEIASKIGPRVVRAARVGEGSAADLERYVEGDSVTVDVPVDLRLVTSDFRRAVLARLREIARGRVTTYGALAARAGSPRAVRAAGTAVGRNPIPIIVPCHRVLPAAGLVGNYGGGVERKAYLLRLEGVLGAASDGTERVTFDTSNFVA